MKQKSSIVNIYVHYLEKQSSSSSMPSKLKFHTFKNIQEENGLCELRDLDEVESEFLLYRTCMT